MSEIKNSKEYFMQQAIALALKALSKNDIPIGCVIVKDNHIIGKGYNSVELLTDSTAHAEMIAITSAQQYLQSKYLEKCAIYITIEPCLMCMGAIVNARLSAIYFGAENQKFGYSQFVQKDMKFNHITIEKGILQKACLEPLQLFLREKRKSISK